MAGLDLETGDIVCELDRFIRPKDRADLPEDCWIYHNSQPPITPELIMDTGASWLGLRRVVKVIIDRYDKVTAYNRQFDIRWLFHSGVDVSRMKLAPCPMLVMTDICRIPHFYGYKWPTFEEAWLEIFGVPVVEPHRAYQDAELEAKLIYAMIGRGIYHV